MGRPWYCASCCEDSFPCRRSASYKNTSAKPHAHTQTHGNEVHTTQTPTHVLKPYIPGTVEAFFSGRVVLSCVFVGKMDDVGVTVEGAVVITAIVIYITFNMSHSSKFEAFSQLALLENILVDVVCKDRKRQLQDLNPNQMSKKR